MIRAIFYKEWIKTRRSVVLMLAVVACFLVYAFIDSAQTIRVNGAVNVWNAIITKDAQLLPAITQWIPSLVALLLALSQFIPEMTDRRLKLTLHLPMSEGRIVASTLAYGLMVLLVLYLSTYIVLAAGFSSRFPAELVGGMCIKTLPWFIAGVCVYLFAAWVCLEPLWRQKIINALGAVCLCSFFFIEAPSGAYTPFIPYLVVFAILCFAFPFYSAGRFKDGAQR